MNLTDWEKRYAMSLLGRQKQVQGSTQKVPLKNMKFAVTPLVLTPFVPFRHTGTLEKAGDHSISLARPGLHRASPSSHVRLRDVHFRALLQIPRNGQRAKWTF